ncbi:MAG: C40 family peptidase [Fibrobacteria bacterium]|nr:C40 family peptidase [Fibrobacteria bacterium]
MPPDNLRFLCTILDVSSASIHRFLTGLTLLALAGCGPKFVQLAENRPAYSRAEGRNLRAALVSGKEIDRSILKSVADTYLGVPYLWGGQTMEGIDCSAFTQQVVKKALSVDLPRVAVQQSGVGVKVFKFALQPGDLLFFGETPEAIDHVGIYMGEGLFINATSSSGVKYSNIDETYWLNKYQFARRLVF